MAKNTISDAKSNTPNTIVSGTVIKGEISTNGDFRIDGKLVGSIICKGKIVVGQSGSIDGEVECQNADISGNMKAKIHVEQLLSLKATAVFSGDIITNKISIEPGAKFSGTCNMEGSTQKPETIHASRFSERQKEKIPG